MLRRVLLFSVIAVALSAAGALAFAPGLSRVSHRLGLGSLWPSRAFTPDPRARNALSPADSAAQSIGGLPGTFCPVRPKGATLPGLLLDPASSNMTPLDSGSTSSRTGQTDLLQPAPAANCTVPAAQAPLSRRSVVP